MIHRQNAKLLSDKARIKDKRPIKVRGTKSKIKTRLMSFFDSHGIIHNEFMPLGQTVNAAFYKDVFDGLLNQIQRV